MNIEQVQEKLLVRINGAIHTHEPCDVFDLVSAYEKLATIKEWQVLPEKVEQGWITDREPDADGEYWVTVFHISGDAVDYGWYRYGIWTSTGKVLAWQPIIKPEPYKPNGDK